MKLILNIFFVLAVFVITPSAFVQAETGITGPVGDPNLRRDETDEARITSLGGGDKATCGCLHSPGLRDSLPKAEPGKNGNPSKDGTSRPGNVDSNN